nr:hypothetical protein [uncultured Draconibacterium sp.]
MSFLEQLERLEHMHQLIKMRATGTPKEFADKIRVSERTIYELLNIARDLGADIEFNRYYHSYIYQQPMTFHTGFSYSESIKIAGGAGKNFLLQKFRSEWEYISCAFNISRPDKIMPRMPKRVNNVTSRY